MEFNFVEYLREQKEKLYNDKLRILQNRNLYLKNSHAADHSNNFNDAEMKDENCRQSSRICEIKNPEFQKFKMQKEAGLLKHSEKSVVEGNSSSKITQSNLISTSSDKKIMKPRQSRKNNSSNIDKLFLPFSSTPDLCRKKYCVPEQQHSNSTHFYENISNGGDVNKIAIAQKFIPQTQKKDNELKDNSEVRNNGRFIIGGIGGENNPQENKLFRNNKNLKNYEENSWNNSNNNNNNNNYCYTEENKNDERGVDSAPHLLRKSDKNSVNIRVYNVNGFRSDNRDEDNNKISFKSAEGILQHKNKEVCRPNEGRNILKNNDMEQWVTDSFYSKFPSLNIDTKSRHHRVKQIDKNEDIKQNYERDSFILSPGIEARQKLLLDLKHTDISKLMYDNGIQDRNRDNLEREAQNKKNYQCELMRQIEEKRRNIEILKLKEKIEEELLTKKLEEQRRVMRLEEELEKKKLEDQRARFEIEQNKLIRDHMIAKLKNDENVHSKSNCSTNSENDIESKSNKNSVYKFFTNSARRDRALRSSSDLQDDALSDFSIEIKKSSTLLQNSCEHFSQNACPFCKIKLKNYESWCKKCEKQIFDDGAENRSMLCENCEKQFLICSSCDKKKNICKFCRRRRHACPNCVHNFCIHCGKTVHDRVDHESSGLDSERSFKILDLHLEGNGENLPNNPTIKHLESLKFDKKGKKNETYVKHASTIKHDSIIKPYSFNLNPNSIFHPDAKLQSNDSNEVFDINRLSIENNFDRMKDITNEISDNYFRLYGDLFETKRNEKRRNINTDSVGLDEMPLLREDPMKNNVGLQEKRRKETARIFSTDSNSSNNMDIVTGKWEIPAVEKRTVNRSSSNSPIVLTQVGAVRRQLQMETLRQNNII